MFNFEPKKQGNCGRKEKLSAEVKTTYRKIIERYFYSFRFLSEEKLKQELKREGYTRQLFDPKIKRACFEANLTAFYLYLLIRKLHLQFNLIFK